MRYFLISIALLMVIHGYSQTDEMTILSGTILDSDSVPVPDMAIINTRTLNTIRTDEKGFFQTTVTGNDSLLIYHIAYKRLFITMKDNGKFIIVEPEINEIKQVDITNNYKQELKNLQETVDEIKRAAPLKKLSKEERKSIVTKFVEENGSHNKGYSPFFGPTVGVPIGKIVQMAGLDTDKRQRKKLTSHYHLIKPSHIKKKNKNSKD